MKKLVLLSVLVGLTFAADSLVVTNDQPLCKIYSLIKTIGSIVAVIMMAYAGFQLMSSTDLSDRKSAKNILMYTLVGLVLIWLAPYIINFLTSSSTCGY